MFYHGGGDESNSDGVEHVECRSKFGILVIVDWLMAKRHGYVFSSSSAQTVESKNVILDALDAIDNLLENCASILEVEDGSPQIQVFNIHLFQIHSSFSSLFEAVDIALSHERVSIMFNSVDT